jgi:magnesium and cobalt transporter
VDEFGGVAGIVTIENVLEQIVGEIEDEHDIDDDTPILKRNETTFMIKALTQVEDFNEYFDTEWSSDDFDTIGGYVVNQLGHLPKRDELISIDNFDFKVVRADTRRVHLFELTVNPKPEPDEE